MTNGESFIYTLKKPFTYADKGQEDEAITIRVECPRNSILREFTAIEELFMEAFKKVQKEAQEVNLTEEQKEEAIAKRKAEKGGEAQVLSPDEVYGVIAAHGKVYPCFAELKKIFAKTAFINGGSQRMTDAIWNDLATEDTRQLLGEYLVNFIVGSLIQ